MQSNLNGFSIDDVIASVALCVRIGLGTNKRMIVKSLADLLLKVQAGIVARLRGFRNDGVPQVRELRHAASSHSGSGRHFLRQI